jgi:hypothetical protein
MNLNLYLPDDLGKRAKDADLPFSQLLREAVRAELERREIMSTTLTDLETIQLDLEDDEGLPYTGRFTGRVIAENDRNDVVVYVTEDERVILYDGERLNYWVVQDIESELADALELSAYQDACRALGIEVVIDL